MKMTADAEKEFIAYLEAKTAVDDRALNVHVWQTMAAALSATASRNPLEILEVGAGIGTMVQRLVDRGPVKCAHFTLVEREPTCVQAGLKRLERWASQKGCRCRRLAGGKLGIRSDDADITVNFIQQNVFTFFENTKPRRKRWDLILAHAFLDLVDVGPVVRRLVSLTRPHGLLYFTLNYDGLTLLLPEIDVRLDRQIRILYDRSMDARHRNGRKSGDSKSGRHLFGHLQRSGADLLAAGSSDWIVFPGPRGYSPEESFFLRWIIRTIATELERHPQLDAGRFRQWIRERMAQIDSHQLVFIARQLDILARAPSVSTKRR